MTYSRWWARFRGDLTPEVRDALARGWLPLTGFSHSIGSGGVPSEESHSFFVDASSAEEALAMARSALAGLPVYVDEDAIRPFEEDAPQD